jgi:DNA-directed RNA polymerase specialized sigma24 family protein
MNENPHDEPLLLRCRAGDRQAFSEIAAYYAQPVYGFLTASLGPSYPRKQVLMREAFAEAFHTYRSGETPSLMMLVLQALLKEMAKEKPLKDTAESFPGTLHTQWLLEAMAQLSSEEKALILLRLQMDRLYEEMAQLMSLPEASVRTKLKEALLHFRECMAQAMKGRYRELRSVPGKNPELS